MQRAFVSVPLKIVRPCIRKIHALSRNSPMHSFVPLLPKDIIETIESLEAPEDVFEVTMDIGRPPSLRRFSSKDVVVMSRVITDAELSEALDRAGLFDSRNRTGIDGTLHRISALLNNKGEVVGLTCRVGRAIPDMAQELHPVLKTSDSLLIVGKPGSGKTSLLRDIAKTLADTYGKRVMIVDKSGEIGGHGDVPHECIGSARRLHVPCGSTQHDAMIEAVENHTPDVILVDEISTFQETRACQTIAERGVRLIGTAHGMSYENIIKNPALNQLVGGVSTVTLGDAAAKSRGTQKTVTERSGPATFTKLIELSPGEKMVVRDTESTIDSVLSRRHVK
jgi:stage III sporulation protein AA